MHQGEGKPGKEIEYYNGERERRALNTSFVIQRCLKVSDEALSWGPFTATCSKNGTSTSATFLFQRILNLTAPTPLRWQLVKMEVLGQAWRDMRWHGAYG